MNKKELEQENFGKELLKQKRKEMTSKLDGYRGEVNSKTNIRQLPDVKKGDVFWVDMDSETVVVSGFDKKLKTPILQPIDLGGSFSMGMTLYDLNKSVISKEPLFDWNNKEEVEKLKETVNSWYNKINQDNKYFLLYGREIHYFTLIHKITEDGDLFNNLKEMLEVFSNLISIDVADTDKENKLEIWVRTEFEKAELLYLFPYDEGLCEI